MKTKSINISNEVNNISDWELPNTLKSYLCILSSKIDVILEEQEKEKFTINEIREVIKLALKESIGTAELNDINYNAYLQKNMIPKI